MKLTNEQQQEASWKAWAADMVKKGNIFGDRDRLMFISGYQTRQLDAIDEKLKELEPSAEDLRVDWPEVVEVSQCLKP